ncbi:MAG: VanW family protein [Saprospiraceae bacterium]|nr:VanW family protein [Saprospiraceae bacterium]
MNIRSIVPRPAKVGLRWVQRRWADYQSGMYGQLAGPTKTDAVSLLLTPALELEQPIMPSAFFENKVHNMQTAATRIQQVLLLPGQVFSFWHVVGYPGARKGYKKGRNLVAGKVQGDYGGGLCQVSGLLYYIALSTGLDILERHSHSIDIYAEEDRFAPLGADATVAFGYKDLRFRNNTAHALRFHITANAQRISAEVSCSGPLSATTPEFIRTDMPDRRVVQTLVGGKIVAVSEYGVVRFFV